MIPNEKELDRIMRELVLAKNIPPKSKDQSIFDLANSFHEAALRCSAEVISTDGTITTTTCPTITCYALAAELYMKAILHSNNITIKTHELKFLYNKLDRDTKEKIFFHYQQMLNERTIKQFEEDILQLSNAFVEWRYIHEQTGVAIAVHRLSALVHSLYVAIRELKPIWRIAPLLMQNLDKKPNLSVMRVLSLGGGIMVRAGTKNSEQR